MTEDSFQASGSHDLTSKKVEEILKSVNTNGYMLLKGIIPPKTVELASAYLDNSDLGPLERETSPLYQPLMAISYNSTILRIISRFFSEEALPMQGLLFKYPTTQPLHQDTVHFSTFPRDMMMAFWVALEDISIEQGPIAYVPKSHLLPTFSSFEFPSVSNRYFAKGEDIEKSYEMYEDELRHAADQLNLKPLKFIAKAGDGILWHPRLWHGGCTSIVEGKTRYSYVTHYMASKTPIYLKHFNGIPLIPRFQNPRELLTGRPLYRAGLLSIISRYIKLLSG